MSKKLRFLIFAFLALVLLLVVGGVAYFLVQSREHVDALRNAMAALEREENDTAIELFKQVLAKDPGNEAATVKLAELYERDGNWLQSSAFWLRAANLNNLKEEYAQQAIASLLRARAFRKIASTLEVRKNLTEDLDLQLLYIYSLLMSNQQRKGIELWEAIRKENPDATTRPWGRLIQVTHFAAELTFDGAYQELDALRQEDQPGLPQEALIAKANLCQLQRQFKDEEENLKTLAQENYFVGTPLLAEFYANHLEYPAAVDLLEEYIPKYSDARLVTLLGEMLVFTSQPERLAPVAEFWRTIPGQVNMKVSYYLDVLQAFLRKDFEQLAKLYPPVRDQIQTPLATFIALLCDAQLSDTARLERDLRAFAAYPPLFDLRDRAHVLILLYLQEQVQAGAPSQELARLAETLLAARLSDRESYTPTMVSLIAKLKNNTLTDAEVSQVLEEFANDPTCLELAATFHYSRRNYAASLNYLQELEKLEAENFSREMKRLRIADLNFLGQNDEAAAKLLQLVAEDPAQEDDGVRALLFLFAQRRADDLQRLADIMAAMPNAAAIRQAIDAATMLLQDRQEEACQLLEPLNAENNDLRYFAGQQLAAAGRIQPAIRQLAAIPPAFPNYLRVCIALSGLYAQDNNWTEATERARAATRLAPSSPEANLSLASCHQHAGSWRQALENSRPNFWQQNSPASAELRKIWVWAMENSIRDAFEQKRYTLAQQLCQQLQAQEPDNAVAAEFAAKVAEQLAPKEPEAEPAGN